MTQLQLYTTEEAARILALAPATLKNWRSIGIGPRFYKLGTRIRYNLPDLEQFLAQSGCPGRVSVPSARPSETTHGTH